MFSSFPPFLIRFPNVFPGFFHHRHRGTEKKRPLVPPSPASSAMKTKVSPPKRGVSAIFNTFSAAKAKTELKVCAGRAFRFSKFFGFFFGDSVDVISNHQSSFRKI